MGKIRVSDKDKGIYEFYCPGCGYKHTIHTLTPNFAGAKWKFNGDLDRPTISPSINFRWGNKVPGFDPLEVVAEDRDYGGICHFFIENGYIRFLNDCTHKYKGVKLLMKDI